jgi:hypothetical protein
MSYVIAAPEMVAAAATDLASIGAVISSANSAAAPLTTAVSAAGADSVSAAIAALFDAHAQAYQILSAQAVAFHAQFVQVLNSGAGSYAAAEAANVLPFQAPLQAVQQGVLSAASAPSQALAGSPFGGSAATVLPNTGHNGGPAAAGTARGVFGVGGPGGTGVLAGAASRGSTAGFFGSGGAGANGGVASAVKADAVGLLGPGGATGPAVAADIAAGSPLAAAPARPVSRPAEPRAATS